MKKIYSPGKLYISQSKISNANRGVFAGEEIKKGETIETSPIIEIPENELENLENSVLTNYIFFFGKKKERMFLALGFGSLYNHSYTPNAKYEIKEAEKIMALTAVRKVDKNEEITINYLQGNKTTKPLWFEVENL